MSEDIEQSDEISSTHIKNCRKFLALLQHRDELHQKLTENLFDLISDNILATFEEIIQLPNRIKWVDLEVHTEENQHVLVLSFMIDYTDQEANKFVLENFGKREDGPKLVKFGILLPFIFAPKDDFFDFVLSITDSSKDDINTVIDTDVFDISMLSTDQLEQLKMFNLKGSIH